MNDRLLCLQIESLGINGLALARGGNAIGVRGIPLLPDYGRFDGKLTLCTLTEIGPHDPGDGYHHLAFQAPVTIAETNRFLRQELFWGNGIVVPDFHPDETATIHLEWCFDGERGAAKFSSDREVDLLLILNGCLAPATVVSGDRRHPDHPSTAVMTQDNWHVHLTAEGETAGAMTGASTLERLEARVRGIALTDAPNEPETIAGQLFRLGPTTPLYIILSEQPALLDPAAIDAALAAGRAAMPARSMTSDGAAAHCADAIQRLVGFSTACDLKTGRRFVAVNRDWAGPNAMPPVFMWDNFFDSYLTCFHHPELAKESLAQILDVIRARGIVGAPPQRNLIVPIVYAKMARFIGERDFAAASFPVLMQFLRFWFADRGDGHPWRDGNDDGLIECGSCLRPGQGYALGRIVQDAFDETGYDDNPAYSAGFGYERRALPADGIQYDFHRGTLNLTMVGQNALYVAACRAMAVLAHWLGETADEDWLRREAERVTACLRARLFDPARGYFQSRFFDGCFSPVETMDIFYPLLAGIAVDTEKDALRQALLDPRRFGGENVIPTVSRDDPAYGDERGREECWRGNYWRGNIWPPTNYISYLAIRNAGWDDATTEFSAKSRRLFLTDWLARHHANENYPPEGGTDRTHLFTGNGGRDPHYIWSALLPLISLEELFSVEDVTDGLRIGTTQPAGYGEWHGFIYHGSRGTLRADAHGLHVEIPGQFTLDADHPIALRECIIEAECIRFRYQAPSPVHLSITTPQGRHAWELPAGSGSRK